jgi:hypothetical protein
VAQLQEKSLQILDCELQVVAWQGVGENNKNDKLAFFGKCIPCANA